MQVSSQTLKFSCRNPLLSIVFAFLLLGLSACKTTPTVAPVPDTSKSASVFDAAKLKEIDTAITQAISTNQLPGGVFWLEHKGAVYQKTYGNRAILPAVEAATLDTIYDAASLTKVLATTPSIMLLVERGQIKIDEPVATYLPEFKANGKDAVTIRHLMTHTSGLRPGLAASPAWHGYAKGIELACAEKLRTPPGTAFVYSDINFIVLGEVVHRVSGVMLNEFAAREIYSPLKMTDTGFLPDTSKISRIAPTEMEADKMLRGVVHDPTSRRMGGVAGHAGLFITASDLARFARMMLNSGELDGVRIFKPETVHLMTTVQSPAGITARRGLGWDIDSPYANLRGTLFPIGSYGHTGWTGTSIWIDPSSKSFWILLSNRNHPDGKGSVISLRKALGTLSARALAGVDFLHPAP